MNKQIIIINGENFSDLEGFYDEIDRVLTKDLDWKTGHNLDAFNDLLRGGFGVYEYEEPVKIIWTNYSESIKRLGSELSDTLIEIITDHHHIEFETKDEMPVKNVKYRDWEFEVDTQLTKLTYDKVIGSGADGCECNDCKNYIAFRENVFPIEVQNLFVELEIDYRKEVEITSFETLPNGLHHIGGWFHFKGRVLNGKDYRVPLSSGGYSIDLTPITDSFSIGFAEGGDLTFFSDKNGLVQIEFMTFIPWVIDKSLEVK